MSLQDLISKIEHYKTNGVPLWIKNICGITFTSIIISVLVLMTTTLFAQHLSPSEFGYVSSYRRLCNLLTAAITGGFIISIPRYISLYNKKNTQNVQTTIFLTISASLMILFCFCLCLLFFKENILKYLLSSGNSEILIYGIALLLATMVFESIIYSIFQGYQSIYTGNILYLTSFGLIPLGYALFTKESTTAPEIIFQLAILRIIFILPIITYFYLKSTVWICKNPSSISELAKEFFYFTFSRLIGGFGMMAIVSIGPIMALAMTSSTEAGYLEISQNILAIVSALSIGINIGLLTHISKLSSNSDTAQIRRKALLTEKISLFAGIYLFGQLFIFTRELIILWLGTKYLASIEVVQLSLLAIIPYALFTTLRGIIDADNIKPINTIITITAFITMVILSVFLNYLGFGIHSIVLGLLSGYFLLGILSVIYINRTYSITLKDLNIGIILLANIIIFAVVWIEKIITAGNLLIIILLNTIIVTVGLYAYYKQHKSPQRATNKD